MDWTAVFDDHGMEDFIVNQQLEQHASKAPRLARLVSRLYHQYDDELSREEDQMEISEHRLFEMVPPSPGRISEHEHTNKNAYTLKALYYLSINYILGVGCLGIPYAFARAGFVLCISILLVVTLCSYMTVMWVAETGERYHAYCSQKIIKHQNEQIERQRAHSERRQEQTALKPTSDRAGNSNNHKRDVPQPQSSEQSPLLSRNMSSDSRSTALEIHQQHWDRYEVIDLVGFYLGPVHKGLYQVALMALMYIGLLAYSQVFCGALSALLWGSKQPPITGISQLIFACMVVPLSCFELDEQISIQSLMAAVRFVAIFIMVFGSLLALFLDDSHLPDGDHVAHDPPYWAAPEPTGCHMSYTVCLSGFGVAFSTSLFSQLFQHSVPGLLRPLRDQPSKHSKVPRTFGASLLTTTSFYLLLGTSAASFFGAETRSSVNLNFSDFTMGLDPNTAPKSLLLAVKLAGGIVVIFPALDTISVFPLIAATLGNNLFSVAVGPKTIKWWARYLFKQEAWLTKARQYTPFASTASNRGLHRTHSYAHLSSADQKALVERSSKLVTMLWRLVAAVPPLIGSLVAEDLSFSLLLAGVAGVYVAFFAPSLMQLKSISRDPANVKTVFNGKWSTPWLCYPVLVFATFSVGTVLVQIKHAWEDMHSANH